MSSPRWKSRTIRRRSGSENIHHITRAPWTRRRAWRSSWRIRRVSTNRLISGWQWSPKRFLVDFRELHLPSSRWTKGSNSVCRKQNHSLFRDDTVTWPGLHIRPWISCRKAVLTIIGTMMGIEICQRPGQDSHRSTLLDDADAGAISLVKPRTMKAHVWKQRKMRYWQTFGLDIRVRLENMGSCFGQVQHCGIYRYAEPWRRAHHLRTCDGHQQQQQVEEHSIHRLRVLRHRRQQPLGVHAAESRWTRTPNFRALAVRMHPHQLPLKADGSVCWDDCQTTCVVESQTLIPWVGCNNWKKRNDMSMTRSFWTLEMLSWRTRSRSCSPRTCSSRCRSCKKRVAGFCQVHNTDSCTMWFKPGTRRWFSYHACSATGSLLVELRQQFVIASSREATTTQSTYTEGMRRSCKDWSLVVVSSTCKVFGPPEAPGETAEKFQQRVLWLGDVENNRGRDAVYFTSKHPLAWKDNSLSTHLAAPTKNSRRDVAMFVLVQTPSARETCWGRAGGGRKFHRIAKTHRCYTTPRCSPERITKTWCLATLRAIETMWLERKTIFQDASSNRMQSNGQAERSLIKGRTIALGNHTLLGIQIIGQDAHNLSEKWTQPRVIESPQYSLHGKFHSRHAESRWSTASWGPQRTTWSAMHVDLSFITPPFCADPEKIQQADANQRAPRKRSDSKARGDLAEFWLRPWSKPEYFVAHIMPFLTHLQNVLLIQGPRTRRNCAELPLKKSEKTQSKSITYTSVFDRFDWALRIAKASKVMRSRGLCQWSGQNSPRSSVTSGYLTKYMNEPVYGEHHIAHNDPNDASRLKRSLRNASCFPTAIKNRYEKDVWTWRDDNTYHSSSWPCWLESWRSRECFRHHRPWWMTPRIRIFRFFSQQISIHNWLWRFRRTGLESSTVRCVVVSLVSLACMIWLSRLVAHLAACVKILMPLQSLHSLIRCAGLWLEHCARHSLRSKFWW